MTGAEIDEAMLRSIILKPNPVILEIGSNDGTHTAWFLELFPNARIYCFEPDSRAATKFEENLGDCQNVTLFKMAVSDKVGKANFYPSSGFRPGDACHLKKESQSANGESECWDASGSLKKPVNHLIFYPWVTFGSAVEVDTTTLDAWCEQHGVTCIDFIWMDVQGAEINVFDGAKKTLPKVRAIYTEYSNHDLYEGQPTLRDIAKALSQFKIAVRYPYDVLFVKEKRKEVRGQKGGRIHFPKPN